MSIVLIFDCGATNLRTIAMNDKGKIMASHHLANNTQQGSESPDYHIWDAMILPLSFMAMVRKLVAPQSKSVR